MKLSWANGRPISRGEALDAIRSCPELHGRWTAYVPGGTLPPERAPEWQLTQFLLTAPTALVEECKARIGNPAGEHTKWGHNRWDLHLPKAPHFRTPYFFICVDAGRCINCRQAATGTALVQRFRCRHTVCWTCRNLLTTDHTSCRCPRCGEGEVDGRPHPQEAKDVYPWLFPPPVTEPWQFDRESLRGTNGANGILIAAHIGPGPFETRDRNWEHVCSTPPDDPYSPAGRADRAAWEWHRRTTALPEGSLAEVLTRIGEEREAGIPPLVRHFAELHSDAILGLSPFLCTTPTGHLRIEERELNLLDLVPQQAETLLEYLAPLRVPVPVQQCLAMDLFGKCEVINNQNNTAPVVYSVIVRHSVPSNRWIRIGTLCRLAGLCLVRAELPEPLLNRPALLHAVALGLVCPAPRAQIQHYLPFMGATIGPSGTFPVGRWDTLLEAFAAARALVSPPPAAVGFFLTTGVEPVAVIWTISSAKPTVINTRHTNYCYAVTLSSWSLAFAWLAKCIGQGGERHCTFQAFIPTLGAQLMGSLIL